MDLTLKRDSQKLTADANRVKQLLETLENDHAIWARVREANDLVQLLQCAEKLETDVSMVMSDFISAGSHEEQNRIAGSLGDAFACLNILFQDLKRAREDLNDAYIYPGEIKQLEIDWSRFFKTISQIQKHLY
jgi:hypothetical protein